MPHRHRTRRSFAVRAAAATGSAAEEEEVAVVVAAAAHAYRPRGSQDTQYT